MSERTLVIIPCGQGKVWDKRPDHGAAAAADAYTGAPFVVNRQYAEVFGTAVVILSAKYGFIPLDFTIPCPYNVTFKRRSTQPVDVGTLKIQIGAQHLDKFDRIVGLGGKEYRTAMTEAFQAFDRTVDFPFAGLPIGKCMQAVKRALRENQQIPQASGRLSDAIGKQPGFESPNEDVPVRQVKSRDALPFTDTSVMCESLHRLFNGMQQFGFPFSTPEIPRNGIYILFEEGEEAHAGQRIVRIGTHTGQNQLRSRLRQHFVQENKDRSIFRKNIGRALLNRDRDQFLADWNLDLTARAARDQHAGRIDLEYQRKIEQQVTEFMQRNFRFIVFPVDDSAQRLQLEALIISTVSLCRTCRPSANWLGLSSPVPKIRTSGLWQVNELDKKPFDSETFAEFQGKYGVPS